MNMTYRRFQTAVRLDNASGRGFSLYLIAFAINVLVYASFYISSSLNFFAILIYFSLFSMYVYYDSIVNRPSFSYCIPMKKSRYVRYVIINLVTELLIALAWLCAALILCGYVSCGPSEAASVMRSSFPDTGVTLGSILPLIQAVSVLIAYIPLTFVSSKKRWYICSGMIIAFHIFMNILFKTASVRAAEKAVSDGRLEEIFGGIPEYFDLIPHSVLIFAVFCIFVLAEFIAAVIVSKKLIAQRNA
ncbi:MAG: hypothetical protein J5994_03480 [Ruminococcus sp.]|nr:hypothetical protein [Ruminococcus sp.]